MSTEELTTDKKVDIYRDTPIRYLGYANEVGEAFRSIIGKRWVLATYGVATLYGLADATDKSFDAYNNSKQESDRLKKTAFSATDTLIWQMLASVIVPGFTINRVCAGANFLLEKNQGIAKSPRQWIVTAIGLATIPFIIKPIDRLVDNVMDGTYRKLAP